MASASPSPPPSHIPSAQICDMVSGHDGARWTGALGLATGGLGGDKLWAELRTQCDDSAQRLSSPVTGGYGPGGRGGWWSTMMIRTPGWVPSRDGGFLARVQKGRTPRFQSLLMVTA